MKVLVIDDNGKQAQVEGQQILIKGKPIIDYLTELEILKKDFRAFVDKSNKREQELIKLWRSIK